MKFSVRTDLAIEAREMCFEAGMIETDIEGVEAEEENSGQNIRVTRVTIKSEKGVKTLGKPKGKYVTVEIPQNGRAEQETYEEACRVCSKELAGLLEGMKFDSVLVVGLGNWNITADAVGPKCVRSVLVTRHLIEYMPEEIDSRLKSVCAVSPGVLGITGVETGEIVRGLVDRVKPTLVIAIDALCSRKMDRIATTIQMSDTGITPGAGVGNKRMGINEETLGVPVIAIGVPTVIEAATVVSDTMDMIVENLKQNAMENEPLFKMLSVIAEEDKYSMIKQILSPNHGDFVVTPKEVDSLVEDVSGIIANGINIALHEGITLEDIDRYK